VTTYVIPPGDTLWAIPDGGRWHIINHNGDSIADVTETGAGVDLPPTTGRWWIANSARPNWANTSKAVRKADAEPCRICGELSAYQEAPWPQIGSGWRHVDPAHEVPSHVGYPD